MSCVPDTSSLPGSADRLLATVSKLTDEDLAADSALPGWTRAHVLTHIAQAADSRTGLLLAARAGRVGRQYASEEARAAAVEAGARRPPEIVRADLHRAVTECLAAIRHHPDDLWDAPGDYLAGGRRPVRGVVRSLRGELEYHHVDLAAGYRPADWPDDFIGVELDQVTGLMDRREHAPPMTFRPPAAVVLRTSPPVEVSGPPAELLAWLSGRGDGARLDARGGPLPELPALG